MPNPSMTEDTIPYSTSGTGYTVSQNGTYTLSILDGMSIDTSRLTPRYGVSNNDKQLARIEKKLDAIMQYLEISTKEEE